MYYDVPKRLNELIEAYGYTTYGLATKLEIAPSTLYTYRYKGVFPPLDKIERICDVLGLTLVDFFIETETRGAVEEAVIPKWLVLSEQEQEAVMAIIDALIDAKFKSRKK